MFTLEKQLFIKKDMDEAMKNSDLPALMAIDSSKVQRLNYKFWKAVWTEESS